MQRDRAAERSYLIATESAAFAALEHVAAQRERIWLTRAGDIAEQFARVVPS